MMGRPSKYKPEYCEQIEKIGVVAQLGLTDKSIAGVLNVDEATINRWKNEYPEFCESLKQTKNNIDTNVEDALYQRALGYTHPEEKVFMHQGEIVTHQTTKHFAPDATSMIFWLKNRQPEKWRDVQENINHNITEGEVSETELARKVAFILTNAVGETLQ